MATLDSVLQSPAPSRQIHPNHSGKSEIESGNQDSSGFEDVMAQSGNKDEVADAETVSDKANAKPSFSKNTHVFNQLKLQLSEKNSVNTVEDASQEAERAPVDPTIETGQLIEKNDDPGKNGLPINLKKIEVMELPKGLNGSLENTGAEVKSPNIGKELTGKVQPGNSQPITPVAHNAAKPLKGSSPEDRILVTIEAIDLTKVFESLEPTEKLTDATVSADLPKVSSDKKADDSKSKIKKDAPDSDPDMEKLDGVKSMLDILGGGPVNGGILIDALPNGRPSLNNMSPETNASNVLQAISQTAVFQGNPRSEAVESRQPSANENSENDKSEVDPDMLFRFSKADSAEKPVDLRLGLKDKSPDSNTSQSQQNKVENIVVLEARRYIGLAPESNAFNLVSRIAGDKELSQAITSSIIDPERDAATSKVVNTLKLQMNPHDLGTITATLRLRGEELTVAITVQNSAAYNHLTSDQDKMIDALRAQGFAVDQVSIQFASSDRSAFQDQQQPQSNSQGQQQPRDGASAQQGRQQGNGTAQNTNAGRGFENGETLSNSPTRANGGNASDGQVYV